MKLEDNLQAHGFQALLPRFPGLRTSSILAPLVLLSLFSCSGVAEPAAPSGTIELSQFEPSFEDNFDTLDVSEWGCLSRWIAHTPWAGDFGDARFKAPGPGHPFTISNGILSIEARKTSDGSWESGMLSSWDACNSGFAQKYGYFEIRTRLPSAPGFWPSFWLVGVDKRQGTAEIDVFEYLTHNPDKLSLGIHKHPRNQTETRKTFATRHEIEPGSLGGKFNTYGVEVTQDIVVFYLNRQEIWRTPMLEEFRQPMYMLISFPTDTGQMDASTPQSVAMEIDYVRAYQRKPIGF